jgi:TonB-dependent receptor
MSKPFKRPTCRARQQLALGTTLVAGLIAQAYAQTPAQTPAPAQTQDQQKLETVVVTGIRASLESSTRAKRDSVGFIDSISAEDMGKFPDSNIAESISRVPGVVLTREITGEGLQIQIRGLGTNFTRVLLNGAPVASASTGRTDSQSANREVDMDFLPGELFSSVTVIKSPTASMLEGGAAGIVDMRSARPFDRKGLRTAFTLTGTKNQAADKWGNRGSALVSNTWGDSFGVLAGVAWATNKVKTTGFETIGWTNANLSATQSSSATRNSTGGGNWTIPGTVPANAGNGLVTGDVINEAYLLAKNPGLNITQIDNALIPRLGRSMVAEGSRDRVNGILSIEARPNASARFFLDTLYGHKKNEFERTDMNWVGRNGSAIPINMQVDRSDCSGGCVVTKGTFANSQYFLEYRPYTEDTQFYSVNPGMKLKITDAVGVDVQANVTRSTFHRQSPTVLLITNGGTGVTTEYDNTGGTPTLRATNPVTGATDILNTPSAFGWYGGSRVNVQEEKRDIKTYGLRGSVDIDAGLFDIKAGGAWDVVARRISSLNNDNYYANVVCGRNLNVYLPPPNTTNPAGCNGTGAAGSAASLYPGYGTGYTAGATTPLQFLGSAIPNSAVPGYLSPSSRGFVTLDWAKFAKDSNYAAAHDTAQLITGSTNTGTNPGYIEERVTSVFTEANGETTLFGNALRYNVGVRYAQTQQTFASLSTVQDPRNAAAGLADGGRYPQSVLESYTTTNYANVLPSASLVYNLRHDVLARLSASKTITRADPTALRALSASFSDPSAQNGSLTNPDLKPYQSKNTDLGLEWYTGREGYIAAAVFRKAIEGFTAGQNFNVPFSALNQYGINWTSGLSRDQRRALYLRAGLPVPADLDATPPADQLAAINALPVTLTQTQNTAQTLHVNGLELTVQQPLDFLPIKGFGVSANYTKVKQSGANQALGVPPHTYNLATYYEGRFGGFRVTKNFTKGSQSAGTGQNGITAAALFGMDYAQVDFTSRLNLGELTGWKKDLQMTFDIFNVTRSIQRSYFQFENAPFTIYAPGRTYQVGLRANF